MFVTQVHRTTFHRAVAHGNTGKNQEPAQTLACKHTEQPEEELAAVNTHNQRRIGLEGHSSDANAGCSEMAGAQRGEASSSCLHKETSSFFIMLVFSKDFRSSKSSSVWTQTRKALNGHQRDGFATPSREPAGASLQLLLQTGNEMGGLFLLIKWQREWDHCCIPSMHAQHWAATE